MQNQTINVNEQYGLLNDYCRLFPRGSGDSEWYVGMETRHIGSFYALVLFVGVAVHAALFTIWATINAIIIDV